MENGHMINRGNYINLWDTEGNYDVWILLHEINPPLTEEEVKELDDLIRPFFAEGNGTIEERRAKAQRAFNELKWPSLSYGGWIVVDMKWR